MGIQIFGIHLVYHYIPYVLFSTLELFQTTKEVEDLRHDNAYVIQAANKGVQVLFVCAIFLKFLL